MFSRCPTALLLALAAAGCSPRPPAAAPASGASASSEPRATAPAVVEETPAEPLPTRTASAENLADETASAEPPPAEPPPSEPPQAAAAAVSFEVQILPILSGRCRPCHFEGGKMYERLLFDRPETIHALGTRLFTRIKEPEEQALIRAFLAREGDSSGPPE